MKHNVGILRACIEPLLLILALPALGRRSNGLFTWLILACFMMHLFMLRGRIRGGGQDCISIAERLRPS
jgi:uncharacterized membrane protein YvlD (DUF360 family)